MAQVNRPERLECIKCGHTWIPRKTEVRLCPNCKTAYWDRPPGGFSQHEAPEQTPKC